MDVKSRVKRYQACLAILSNEPEEWLAFLYGQKLDSLPHLTESSERQKGLLRRILVFMGKLIRGWGGQRGLNELKEISPCYIFFVGTANQYSSSVSTIEALKRREENVGLLVTRGVHGINSELSPAYCRFTITDICTALTLFVKRAPSLLKKLKANHPAATELHFDRFCETYGWLAYFYRVLKSIGPKYVVVANDHNVPNRCLLAVARYLGIDTVYMQHASVSEMFPALIVNYAFLDGNAAYETYIQCQKNRFNKGSDAPHASVFLTGQKKKLGEAILKKESVVGVAVNILDDPLKIIELARSLSAMGYTLCFRWHPAQSLSDLDLYRDGFRDLNVIMSDPRVEHVSSFLGKLMCLISGNSSIHLEAAIMGIRSIYYETVTSVAPDYYGYVKNGVSEKLTDLSQLMDLLNGCNGTANSAVSHYSSTYGTKWQGREGELTAVFLTAIQENRVDALRSNFAFCFPSSGSSAQS